jgi:3-dehydroquinate synthetase
MLDSSVGGKTAINIAEGKNLIGTFWPPRVMLADVEFARSLPADHLRSGVAEAIKMAIGFDAGLFELLAAESARILAGDPQLLTQMVTLAVQAKIRTVEADPLETLGRRRCLNLGHTLAHALEALSDYRMLHGHAVAQGLHFALDVAERCRLIETSAAQRCRALLLTYGFVRQPIPTGDALLPFFERDKKMAAGLLHFVVPTAIGTCRTEGMTPRQLVASGAGGGE